MGITHIMSSGCVIISIFAIDTASISTIKVHSVPVSLQLPISELLTPPETVTSQEHLTQESIVYILYCRKSDFPVDCS